MKPHRIRMVHSLLVNYGLYRHLQLYVTIAVPLLTCLVTIETAKGHGRGYDAIPLG